MKEYLCERVKAPLEKGTETKHLICRRVKTNPSNRVENTFEKGYRNQTPLEKGVCYQMRANWGEYGSQAGPQKVSQHPRNRVAAFLNQTFFLLRKKVGASDLGLGRWSP